MKLHMKSCWICLPVTEMSLGKMGKDVCITICLSCSVETTFLTSQNNFVMYNKFEDLVSIPPCHHAHTMLPMQESLRPFPWPRSRNSKRLCAGDEAKPVQASTDVEANAGVPDFRFRETPATRLRPLVSPPDFTCLTIDCNNDGFLDTMLPPEGATAGKVLGHTKSAMMTLFAKHEPMIFKIGYSHNAIWRWSNSLYGYKFDKMHKWSNMVVLYESTEPFGPAMLEASLIDLFHSILN